jgi:energy-coupling factor transporter ATP-binding protein EcfA2
MSITVPSAPLAHQAERRSLRLVWGGSQAAQQATDLPPVAHWELQGVAVADQEFAGSVLARFLSKMDASQSLDVEHIFGAARPSSTRYRCLVTLHGASLASPPDPDSITDALTFLAPGMWFKRVPADGSIHCKAWPLVAWVKPATTRLWHDRAPAQHHDAPSYVEAPYPTLWSARPLNLSSSDLSRWGHGVRIVQRIRPFQLDDSAQVELHATMRRLQAGALRCYGKDSPLSPFSGDPVLRQALIALMQQWLIKPRGCCFDMQIHAPQTLPAAAIDRLAREVFGHMPFDVSKPGPIEERRRFADASLPDQGVPALWPHATMARSLGTRVLYAPPATAIPDSGLLIGQTSAGPASTPVYLPPEVMTRHVMVSGSSGSGKSTLMLTAIAGTLSEQSGNGGVGFVTPHTDDANRLMNLISLERLGDVVLIDPEDLTHSACLNPLQGMRNNPARAHRVASQVCDLIDMLFETQNSIGPMIRSNIKHLVLLAGLRPDRNGTFLDMVRILEDIRYRDWLIGNCPDPAVASYWKRFIATNGDNGYQNWLPYMQARLVPFTANPKLKRLLCRPESTVNLRQAMDDGKIIICNLSKSVLQDTECRALGALLLAMFHDAVVSRGDQDPSLRRPFQLFVDEFQSFAGDGVGRMFAEVRKFGMGLCVSFQQTAQLANRWGRDSFLDSVLTNTATKFLFRQGTPDLGPMSPHYAPAVSPAEMARLPDFHAVATLPQHGQATTPFVMHVLPPETPATAAGAQAVRKHAQLHCTPIEQANQELMRLFDLPAAVLV